MNQLKPIYNSPFKDSHSHPIHTYFPIIASNVQNFVLGVQNDRRSIGRYRSTLCVNLLVGLQSSLRRGGGPWSEGRYIDYMYPPFEITGVTSHTLDSDDLPEVFLNKPSKNNLYMWMFIAPVNFFIDHLLNHSRHCTKKERIKILEWKSTDFVDSISKCFN